MRRLLVLAGMPQRCASPRRSFGARPSGGPVAGIVAICLLLAAVPEAHAEFTVCNQTLDVANVAIGQHAADAPGEDEAWMFQTEGWWTIGANQCVDVIREELANRFVYVHARDVFGQPMLSGTTNMCIDGRRFVIRGIEDCWQRGHQAAKFVEVDTLEQERWTLFLTSVGP